VWDASTPDQRVSFMRKWFDEMRIGSDRAIEIRAREACFPIVAAASAAKEMRHCGLYWARTSDLSDVNVPRATRTAARGCIRSALSTMLHRDAPSRIGVGVRLGVSTVNVVDAILDRALGS
jgi:hypothetical protein